MCKASAKASKAYQVSTTSTHTSEGTEKIKNIQLLPKDKDPIQCKVVLYTGIDVTGWLSANEEYIGKSTRTIGETCKEHLKAPPIQGYHTTTGHQMTMDTFSIVSMEGYKFVRTIKESINIGVNRPTLNKNIGKYNLTHLWDGILVNTPELQIMHQ